jgi:hypothetical protein
MCAQRGVACLHCVRENASRRKGLEQPILACAGEQFRESSRRSASGSGSASPAVSGGARTPFGSSPAAPPNQALPPRGRALGASRLSVRLIDYEAGRPLPYQHLHTFLHVLLKRPFPCQHLYTLLHVLLEKRRTIVFFKLPGVKVL